MRIASATGAGSAELRTNIERLYALFVEHRGEWLSAIQLTQTAGLLSWHARLSELRRPPFNLQITNRVRRIRTATGRLVVFSEYRAA